MLNRYKFLTINGFSIFSHEVKSLGAGASSQFDSSLAKPALGNGTLPGHKEKYADNSKR
jgi:hypothetical protein